jgi:hypothetical protein
MSVRNPVNMAHSVHQRLLNVAKATRRSFNELLQYYGMERFLYRLAQTSHGDILLLKGALLLRAWGIPSARPTIDIDMTNPRDLPVPELLSMIRASMEIPAETPRLYSVYRDRRKIPCHGIHGESE